MTKQRKSFNAGSGGRAGGGTGKGGRRSGSERPLEVGDKRLAAGRSIYGKPQP